MEARRGREYYGHERLAEQAWRKYSACLQQDVQMLKALSIFYGQPWLEDLVSVTSASKCTYSRSAQKAFVHTTTEATLEESQRSLSEETNKSTETDCSISNFLQQEFGLNSHTWFGQKLVQHGVAEAMLRACQIRQLLD